MKKGIGMFFANALASMGVMAEITNTVKVTKFHQSYPYSGKATVEYTVGGAAPRKRGCGNHAPHGRRERDIRPVKHRHERECVCD